MKNLDKKQWVAVISSLAVLTYLLFSNNLLNLFSSPTLTQQNLNTQVQRLPVTAEEVTVGEGLVAEPGDTLTVHYVGTLSDGRVFDSSIDRNVPFSFILGVGQVIRGWDEGLVGMRVGGKRVLTIEPEYGYGEQGVGPITPNSTLIFEVELLDTQKAQQVQVE